MHIKQVLPRPCTALRERTVPGAAIPCVRTQVNAWHCRCEGQVQLSV